MICCTCGNQSKFTISCYGNQKRRLPFLFCIRKRKWSLHHSRKQIGTVFINLWHLARNWHLLAILFSASNAILFSLITCSKLQKSVMDIKSYDHVRNKDWPRLVCLVFHCGQCDVLRRICSLSFQKLCHRTCACEWDEIWKNVSPVRSMIETKKPSKKGRKCLKHFLAATFR